MINNQTIPTALLERQALNVEKPTKKPACSQLGMKRPRQYMKWSRLFLFVKEVQTVHTICNYSQCNNTRQKLYVNVQIRQKRLYPGSTIQALLIHFRQEVIKLRLQNYQHSVVQQQATG